MLYLVATPIGNLEDISARALRVLREAAVIACEDTRRTRQLLTHFGIPTPARLVSYRQGNEEREGERLLAWLAEGLSVALCTDGGLPAISDPGYRIVRLAVARNVPFEVLPGPSAVTTALVCSGLPTSSFTFKGYPPRKPGALRRFLEQERELPHTLVLFESPFRVGHTLRAALEVLGNREAAVCLELTKRFERVARGSLAELAAQFDRGPVKGEITLVIAGNNAKFLHEPEEPLEDEQGSEAATLPAEARDGFSVSP